MTRTELINTIYGKYNEDARLTKSRQGQLEYITTMDYIHRYLKPGASVLEVGAGTGRYSVALAREGYDVKAVELVPSNIEVMKKNIGYLKNIEPMQGDALDLSRFQDDTFDVTLVLGPMYHLYEKADWDRCIEEAVRVTKKDGVIFFAFLSVYAIMYVNYLQGNFDPGLEENFDADMKTRHFTEQAFTGFDVTEFESLFTGKNVTHITTAAADGLLELAQGKEDFKMGDHDFKLFVKYHLATCEKRELLGMSSHLLYMCRKN
ncbi:MAG: methyltransferase domain-containing protein [Treponema sp.]|nr:methyltransferase domain-containing protein [Candidatus Treponema caballi]